MTHEAHYHRFSDRLLGGTHVAKPGRARRSEPRGAARPPPPERRSAGDPAPEFDDPEFVDHIDEAVRTALLVALPTYILAATPHGPAATRERFDIRNRTVAKRLAQPPQVRDFGFDLQVGSELQPAIDSVQLLSDHYKGLEDGTLVFVATGGLDFLCWGMDQLRLNPAALSESALLFAQLSRQVYGVLKPAGPDLIYRLEFRDMSVDGGELVGPLVSDCDEWRGEDGKPMASDVQFTICHPRGAGAGAVAFSLVAQVYAWFGIHNTQIPYTEEVQGGHGVISPALMQW